MFMKQLTTIKHTRATTGRCDKNVVLTCTENAAWDAFAFTEVLLTQPVMVVVVKKSVPSVLIVMDWKSMAGDGFAGSSVSFITRFLTL